ncbi:MAG: hypothetical protein JOZ51_03680 [Chloroflexi bacterium]|nr:hypothetical protein [Chloroflexota bacterium]
MSLTMTAITSVVAMAAKYLLASTAVQQATEEAANRIGELSGEALTTLGASVVSRLRSALNVRSDAANKANRALDDVASDPADEDYQHKLVRELDKLAQNDTSLRDLLTELSAEVERAGGAAGQTGFLVSGDIYGPTAGTNAGSMNAEYTFNARNKS